MFIAVFTRALKTKQLI